MNTIKSVYYGWGTLIVAGGGAYYFAKRSINADRAAKAEAEHKKRLAQYELEAAYTQQSSSISSHLPPSNPGIPSSSTAPSPASTVDATRNLKWAKKGREERQEGKERADKDWHMGNDEASSPSHEASADPAATRHAPEDEGQKVREKSKYEASDVYRSRKGDRFS